MRLDARAWLIWFAAAFVLTMIARNPLYTLVLLLVVRLVIAVCALPGTESPLPLLRVGVAILLLTTLFNTLSVHVGQTVLFRLPTSWPWVGGPITAEAAVFGLSNGLVLWTLLAIFSGLNQVTPASDLVRLLPQALRDLGVVVLIALTYVPQTARQWQRIREAQAIRGHRLQRVRDWRPIVIPLLVGGLERAMGLAEAMVARGYGATAATRQPLAIQLGLLLGLVLAFGGWVLGFWQPVVGRVLLVAGIVLVFGLLWRQGRSAPRTHYRAHQWQWVDTAVMVTAVAPLLLVLLSESETLAYTPYPALTLPGFAPLIGMGLFLLSGPAWLQLYLAGKDDDSN